MRVPVSGALLVKCRVLLAAALAALSVTPGCLAQQQAEWTLLVYMNGKNNLEPHALSNFHDMASIGSTPAVNIVVELGRPSKQRHARTDGDWSGVLRFYVKKNTRPLPNEAVEDLGQRGEPTDMGSRETFRRFVSWAKSRYPAKRYMVIIWNHGQGWRYQLAPNAQARALAGVGRIEEAKAVVRGQQLPVPGGFRAVSSDEDTQSILFNRDVQDALAEEFPRSRPLDLLGYDACLMAMLETGYGLAPYVRVMVASEELEPGSGWHYSAWLDKLVRAPTSTAEALAGMIVDAYNGRYGNSELTTLSVVRLAALPQASLQLSDFAKALLKDPKERGFLLQARKALLPYGSWYDASLNTSIDLIALLEQYEKLTANTQLKNHSSALRKAFGAQILKNYASTRSADPSTGLPFGSRGIAIYFPQSAADFKADFYHDGYLKRNTYKPVDFVRDQYWADLLYAVLGTTP